VSVANALIPLRGLFNRQQSDAWHQVLIKLAGALARLWWSLSLMLPLLLLLRPARNLVQWLMAEH